LLLVVVAVEICWRKRNRWQGGGRRWNCIIHFWTIGNLCGLAVAVAALVVVEQAVLEVVDDGGKDAAISISRNCWN
jgi:hypothetical protein